MHRLGDNQIEILKKNGFEMTPMWVRDMDGNELSFRYEKTPEVFQNYSLDKGILIVELEKELSPDDTIVFDIDFETKFPRISITTCSPLV